jgi:hypothetical protein
MRYELTVIAKFDGPLTKRIHLDGDHLANASSACVMSRGRAKRFQFDTAQQLADLIGGQRPNEAIVLGALRGNLPDKVEVVTKSS